MSEAEDYERINGLNERILWVRGLTGLGTVVTTVWIMYHAFKTGGFLTTIVGLVFLSIIYRFGVAPLFAVVTSLLHFYFHLVGIWLPIISYLLAAFLLYMDLRLDTAKRRATAEISDIDPSA